jgi:hypothetical protein
MIIISHRGYWKDPAEKNQPVAFDRSFDLGFGTETDVRDVAGTLVISHDMPKGGELTLDGMLDILGGRDLPMAMNVKADGLAQALQAQMAARGLSQWFTFDMSVPETVVQLRLGLPVYTRASEYERPPALYDQAIGVWLDAFVSEWFTEADINAFLQDGKKVAIVSSDLHKRDHKPLWEMLKSSTVAHHPNLMLCTDLPEDAVAFMGRHT